MLSVEIFRSKTWVIENNLTKLVFRREIRETRNLKAFPFIFLRPGQEAQSRSLF